MTFSDWQQRAPVDAAREVHARIRTRLAPAQRPAVHSADLGEHRVSKDGIILGKFLGVRLHFDTEPFDIASTVSV